MAKCVWNKVVELGFKGKYSKVEYAKLAGLVRAAIGLPYVPLKDLDKGFNHLKKMASELKGKSQQEFGKNFISYIKNTWMDGNYDRESWNYYQHRGVTTNNHQEGYNYRIGQRKGLGIHPNPYLLTGVIRNELKKSVDDDIAASVGNPNIRKNKTYNIDINARRKELMKSLHEKEIALPDYMVAMGALSLKHDKRIKVVQPSSSSTTENIAAANTIADISINESDLQEPKGDDLKNARKANDYTLSFRSQSFTYFFMNYMLMIHQALW